MSDITENTVESAVENTQETNTVDNSQELINELKQRLEQAEKQLLEVKEESIGRRKKLKNEKQEKETVLSEKQQLELEMSEMKKQLESLGEIKSEYENKILSDWDSAMEKLSDDEKALFDGVENVKDAKKNLALYRKLEKAGKLGKVSIPSSSKPTSTLTTQAELSDRDKIKAHLNQMLK